MPANISYAWDFGDGRTSTESNPTHIYKMAGVYTVTLTVVDQFGSTFTSTSTIRVYDWELELDDGLNVNRTDQCLRLSMAPKNGFGWSEFGGSGWPFPEARVGTMKLIDAVGREHLLVLNAADGAIIEIGMRDVFTDRIDDYTTYEIPCRVEFKEEVGGAEHYKKESLEHHLFFRPHDEDFKGQPGYTETGYRDAFEVEFALRKDGEQIQDTLVTRDIPLYGDLVFRYQDDAHRWQSLFRTTTSAWKMVKAIDYYINQDKIGDPVAERQMSEESWALELAATSLHVDRNEINPVLDYATGNTMSGSNSARATGPDTRSDSALVFAGTGLTSVNNVSLTGDFTVSFWVRAFSSSQVVVDNPTAGFACEVSLVPAGTRLRFSDTSGNVATVGVEWVSADWLHVVMQRRGTLMRMFRNGRLVYSQPLSSIQTYNDTIGVMRLGTGEVFSTRVINSAISADAIQFHYEDVTRREGKATCPLF